MPEHAHDSETRRPHVLLMANRMLGWNSYSRQVEAVLSRREDMRLSVIWRRPSRLGSLFLKQHGGRLSRLWRHGEVLSAYRGALGRDIRDGVGRLQPDVVHFAGHWPAAALSGAGPWPPVTAALDCTRAGINGLPGPRRWTDAEAAAEARFLAGLARLYPMSDWAARSLTGACEIPPRRVSVMPPAVRLQQFAPPVPHDGPPNILFIGNDFSRKGGARLVDWVNGPLAGRCRLHIVSRDPAARAGGAHVTVHGGVDHGRLFGDIMPRMDLFCLPTTLDMSPNVLAEAAAAALPAVASRIGGIPDMVRDGETGVLVDPDDGPGFVAALDRLICDPPLRSRMARAARRLAESRFDANRSYGRLADDLIGLALSGTGRKETAGV